jgi:hypothetical protein
MTNISEGTTFRIKIRFHVGANSFLNKSGLSRKETCLPSSAGGKVAGSEAHHSCLSFSLMTLN